MNFKPDEKNIRSLLKSGCQFVIPRFQREYSWDKKNYQEFFEAFEVFTEYLYL